MSVKNNSVLLNKTNTKADSIIYADKLYSYKANVCKHSEIYDQSSPILERAVCSMSKLSKSNHLEMSTILTMQGLFQLINRQCICV